MSDSQPLTALDRQAQLRRVVDDVLVRRAQGEQLADVDICEQHAELLPELASELRKLRVIQLAREQLQSQTEKVDLESQLAEETAAYVHGRQSSLKLSRSLHIRCPLCHEPFEIVVDQPLDDIHCTACAGRFSLAGDDPKLRGKKGVTRIAHFDLIERLGMGGFGTVWKAHDAKLDRTVALKIPRQGQLSIDEVEEFLFEAKVAARLKHPNIVSVHEIGRDGDNVFIISDLIEGVSLARFNDSNRLTHREVAQLLITICDALHFAHQEGIVHRDLKPGNILLDAQDQPHITDFGLAKRSFDEVAITLEGDILGTPAYMSPEQARGDAHLADCRTDVYSIGVMLFELLTGFLPFRGSMQMLTYHAIHTEPTKPRMLNSSIPRDLETICLKCLEKDPRRRYASAKELADELRRYLSGDAILARPISSVERLWRWCKRNPRIPILSASLLLVVALAYGVAWVWFQSIYDASDRALTSRALANVQFTAASIATTAGNDFEQYYEAVEEAADDADLQRLLQQMIADDDLKKLYPALHDPERDDAQVDPLRHQLEGHPLCEKTQKWVKTLPLTSDLPAFAWFVILPDGLQVARNPTADGGAKTIGRNYSWRAYFHGGPEDHDDRWRAGPNEHLQTTHLSPAFVSRFTNEWVVVISAPVHDPQQPEKFLGVIGLMLRLGSFAKLPGNQQAIEGPKLGEGSFAVLVDSRPPNAGQVLQHPLYNELAERPEPGEKVAPRRRLLDRSQDTTLRSPLGEWQAHDVYRDPFASVGTSYDRRWLASKLPVKVRGQETGLFVIVQESYDEIIGQALGQLRRGLILLSLVTFGLTAAIVVPLWVIILRLVR